MPKYTLSYSSRQKTEQDVPLKHRYSSTRQRGVSPEYYSLSPHVSVTRRYPYLRLYCFKTKNTACSGTFLRNVDLCLHHYTISQPKRLQSEPVPLFERSVSAYEIAQRRTTKDHSINTQLRKPHILTTFSSLSEST